MGKRWALGGVGALLAVVLIWIGFTLMMRTKLSPVLTAIRRLNRAVEDPRAMDIAGQHGAYASVVRHVGRRTGTAHETPVQALPTDDGFAIPLPYGSASDWLKNVMAAGSAVIVNEGDTYRVDHPEIVPAEVADPWVPPRDQRTNRWYGVDTFLLVRRAATNDA